MIVQIEPSHRIVHCEEGEGLLDVLLRESVPVSYSCKVGHCGLCEVEPFELFKADRRQRSPLVPRRKAFLACQRNVVKDIGIRLPEGRPVANIPFQYHQASIASFEEIAPGIVQIDFDTGKKLARFFPGQKFALSLNWGRSLLLMPVNSPGKCKLSFLIESGAQEALVVELLEKASSVQKINLVGPIGNGYFVPDDSASALVCAVGMGLVAARSIVETLAEGECSRPLKLLLAPSPASAHLVGEICDLCSKHLPQAEILNLADLKHGLASPSRQKLTTTPAETTADVVDCIQNNFQQIKAEQAYAFAPSYALMAIKMGLIGAGIEANAVFMENADINFVEEENVDVS
ncbi:2Fe-2S iron-sulfur cluster-binding protein [Pelagerythrobacter aerophilus]